MHITRSFTFSCLALVVLIALGGQAFSATVAVGTCTTLINFATIQLAVNSVPAGSTIEICPGTYPEQVVISKKLTLIGFAIGTTQDAAVIVPPAGGVVMNATDVSTSAPIAAQLLVENTAGPVKISNLTVDGLGNGLGNSCALNLDGILFQNASGTLNHVAVRNQIPGDVLGGCQTGDPIYVESSTGTSVVTIENSSVHNYNKNGITGRYAGTTMTVTGSYVQGSGLLPYGLAAQNGIELAFGAAGKISGNTVIDNFYGDPTFNTASDILLYDAAESSGITVTNNILGNSQVPIGLYTDTPGTYGDGVTVTGNKIFGTGTWDAIDVCTNSNIVTGNTIFNSAESAVHLDAACVGTGTHNIATGNTILESACAGILDDTGGSGSNSYGTETYYTVPFPITYSTTACTIPEFAGAVAHAKTTHKSRPSE